MSKYPKCPFCDLPVRNGFHSQEDHWTIDWEELTLIYLDVDFPGDIQLGEYGDGKLNLLDIPIASVKKLKGWLVKKQKFYLADSCRFVEKLDEKCKTLYHN